MKFQHKILASAAIFALSASWASAHQFFLDPGVDLDGSSSALQDPDTQTGLFTFMNFKPNATSVYTERASGTGLNNDTDGLLKNGETLDFVDIGSVNIGSFNDVFGTTDKFATSFEGFNDNWQLRIDYAIGGSATYSGATLNMRNITNGQTFAANAGLFPTFNNQGKFNVYLVDIGSDDVPNLGTPTNPGTKLLQMNVNGSASQLAPGNLELSGEVDYTWLASSGYNAATKSAIENFFKLANGTSFYQSWANNKPVTWEVQTNIEPNLIPRNNVAPNGTTANRGKSNVKPGLSNVNCAAGTFCRTTSLNMNVDFSAPVPEPEVTLMIGLGMLGLGLGFGAATRRKSKSAA